MKFILSVFTSSFPLSFLPFNFSFYFCIEVIHGHSLSSQMIMLLQKNSNLDFENCPAHLIWKLMSPVQDTISELPNCRFLPPAVSAFLSRIAVLLGFLDESFHWLNFFPFLFLFLFLFYFLGDFLNFFFLPCCWIYYFYRSIFNIPKIIFILWISLCYTICVLWLQCLIFLKTLVIVLKVFPPCIASVVSKLCFFYLMCSFFMLQVFLGHVVWSSLPVCWPLRTGS